jgi:hypothetical protein
MFDFWILGIAAVGLAVGLWLFGSAFSRGLKFSDDYAQARRRPGSTPEE